MQYNQVVDLYYMYIGTLSNDNYTVKHGWSEHAYNFYDLAHTACWLTFPVTR